MKGRWTRILVMGGLFVVRLIIPVAITLAVGCALQHVRSRSQAEPQAKLKG